MMRPDKGPSQPALILNHGGSEPKTFFLNKNAVTIGKARGCDVPIDAAEVSAIHCVICRTSGFYEVRDCASRTGTRVNGDGVAEALLHDGDVLQVGGFSFQVALPDKKSASGGVERKLKHLDRSRRNIVRLALELRGRLKNGSATSGGSDIHQKASGLRVRVRDYELRQTQLEQGERDLARGRELLEKERREFKANVAEVESELAQWEDVLAKKKAEIEQLQQNQPEANRDAAEAWLREQTEALREEQEAVRQAEDALRQQRGELTRMIAELREIQEAIRGQQRADALGLQEENAQLRRQLEEQQAATNSEPNETALQEIQQLRKENQSLRQLAQEKEAIIVDLKRTGTASSEPMSDKDLESYEAELNHFRQQLEADRKKLALELEQIRLRNQELDEATREMEMELSRERAELARERTRLDRMREEVKAESERLQRDAGVKQSLAPVQKLRQDLTGAKRPAAEKTDNRLDERLRAVNNHVRGKG